MRALDSSILLALLEGEPGAKTLLKKLRGVEVATTEANLLELSILASQGSERHHRSRREALGKLRRRITVLPIDARAVEAAATHLGKDPKSTGSPLVLAMMGALEAGGCEELLTQDPLPEMDRWKVRVSRVRLRDTK